MKFTLLSEGSGYREYWAKIGNLPNCTSMNVRVHLFPDQFIGISEIVFYVVTDADSTTVHRVVCTRREAWNYITQGTPDEGSEPPL